MHTVVWPSHDIPERVQLDYMVAKTTAFAKNLEIACCESVQVQVVHHVSLCYITILAKQLSAVALINVYHYTSNGTGMYEVESLKLSVYWLFIGLQHFDDDNYSLKLVSATLH